MDADREHSDQPRNRKEPDALCAGAPLAQRKRECSLGSTERWPAALVMASGDQGCRPSVALPVKRGGTSHRRNRLPNRVPDSAYLIPLRDIPTNEKPCKRTGHGSGMPLLTTGPRSSTSAVDSSPRRDSSVGR